MKHYVILLTLFSIFTVHAEPTQPNKQPPADAAPPEKIITSDAFSTEVNPASISKVANAVADWQIANPYDRKDWDWTEGALWTGLTAHAESTQNAKYTDYLKSVSKGLDFQLGPRRGFGDDHCVGQLHLWHYLRDELPAQIQPTQDILTEFITRPHTEDLLWVNHIHMREWAWCDALYMGPPTLATLHAATGDIRYLDTMDKLYWKSYEYMYNKEEHLFFRDSTYFKKKEKNGENVYWSRGNGWVFAGLAHILMHMPDDYPSRPKYVALFREMAAKLKSLQLADGSWRPSLLDPDSFPSPETSGTAFFAYGFMWGINNDILDEKEYLTPATKAWKRLVQNVHADGKLGYIQPIGADPRQTTFDNTAVYGVGGFLQLAYELQKHLILSNSHIESLQLTNPSNKVRLNEVVEIPWINIIEKLPTVTVETLMIRDTVRGNFLPLQFIDADKNSIPEAILIQCDFTPLEKRNIQIISAKKTKNGYIMPKSHPSVTTARAVPERKDDFAWENDRIAFRGYGPALAEEGAKGGFDVWTKSVRTRIVDEWYRKDDYHTNNGTGLDGYKVGATLGCGGLGFIDASGKLHTGSVYAKSVVLENGPIRLKFKLTYPAIEIDGVVIMQSSVITMNAGSHAFQVEASFRLDGKIAKAKGIRPVAGLAIRAKDAKPALLTNHLITYADPVMLKDGNGITTTFLLTPDAKENKYPKVTRKPDHLVRTLAKDLTKPVRYYAGAVWNRIYALDQRSADLLINDDLQSIRYPISVEK